MTFVQVFHCFNFIEPHIIFAPNGANIGFGYNIGTGNFGMGSNTDGFSNFEYPSLNYASPVQITENAIAGAREKASPQWANNLGLTASLDGTGMPNISQLAYREAKDNFLGSTDYTGKCSNYVYDVYNNIGYPLGKFNTAANTGSYPTLEPTTYPVQGDIVQYLKSDGARFDHVAIYAGDNSMFSSSTTRNMIITQTLLQFNKSVTPHYFHYVGQ